MSDTVLYAEKINKSYKSRRGTHTVLSDLSFQAEEGKFYAIEGESGSGKSTFLSILGGLQKSDDGEIVYRDCKLSELSDDELTVLRRHDIVYVPQSQDVLPTLNVIDNIRIIDFFDGDSDSNPELGDTRLSLIVDQLGIQELRNEYPAELSGGELRRLCIARALYSDPKVILADEPTNDLDKENREKLGDIFRQVADKGISVVVVTHDSDLAAKADERLFLSDGKLKEKKINKS